MALPSSVTLGSLALVVAAGVGFVAVTSSASEDTAPIAAARPTGTTPTTGKPTVVTEKPPQQKTRQHKPPMKPASVVPPVLVEVYNNSGVSGLAADKAAGLQDAGWNVAGTDNWYGNIVANTVYYPESLRPKAVQLAKELAIARLRPAISPMQFDRLTVIFTSAG